MARGRIDERRVMTDGISQGSLLSSAQRWTQRALQVYTTPDRDPNDDSMLLFCSISWEHLCKAYLYSLEPALIFDTARSSRSGRSFTIRLKDAQSEIWQRRGLARDSDRRRLSKLEMLADVRNGVLHAAVLNVDDHRELLVEYLTSSEELYDELLSDIHWGDFSSLVSALISEPQNYIRERVETKKLVAARRRKEIIGAGARRLHDGEEYDISVSSLICERMNNIYDKFKFRGVWSGFRYCPVCKEDDVGMYAGVVVDEIGGTTRQLLYAFEFICAVCELNLPTVEEMSIAGLDVVLELE